MDSRQPQSIKNEKDQGRFEEKVELNDGKQPTADNVDYTGSVAKTDPVEIKLVRKIDWRLMVSDTKSVEHSS